jgi:hypothetical protein
MAHPVGPGAAPLSLEPALLLWLSLSAALYAAGWRRLRARGRGRARPAAWRAVCHAGGLAAIGLVGERQVRGGVPAGHADILISRYLRVKTLDR